MRNKLILMSSLVLAIAGFSITENQLLMMVGENGELFQPLSSGGDDPMGIKMGLMSYSVTAIYTVLSLAFKKGTKNILGIYIVNSLICAFYFGVILLDSSILEAAKAGNALPAIVYITWVITIILVVVSSPFNKQRQNDAKDARLL